MTKNIALATTPISTLIHPRPRSGMRENVIASPTPMSSRRTRPIQGV